MTHNYKQAFLPLLLLTALMAQAQTLLHSWNFNTLPSGPIATAIPADFSLPAGTTSITYPGTGTGYVDRVDGDVLNAETGVIAGYGLRPRNPANTRELLIAFPTTGYKDVVLTFATTRTGSGATEQRYSYSLDGGTTFITTGLPIQPFSPVEDDYTLSTIDLSSIDGADNNPNLVIRINFGGSNASGGSGNNRFDNIAVKGTLIPAPQLLHYWNFNSLPSGQIATAITADFSELGVANTSITYPGTGDGYIDRVAGDVLNAEAGVIAGYALRPRNPASTRELLIAFPTTGYEDVVLKFAATRTGSGATEQTYSYSLDGGTTFITTGLSTTPFNPEEDTYTLSTIDLSSISGADNNPDLVIKINFGGPNAANTSGNNRFDNVTVYARPLEGTTDVTPPTVTILPAYNAVNMPVNTQITIEMNEAVRLINDSSIDNTNVDALVQLRLNDIVGAIVPFDATFGNNTITIVPSAPLANNQLYYVELLPNTIEDMSGNALQAGQSSVFKTIAVQTPLAAGDLIPVAYRMSATGADDAIALLTLVDIAPGTFIHLADNKYTTNAQPQCAGGFDWTATNCVPAGSVIVIQTDAGTASTGTIDENADTFGLSSSGDQVIIYTGTAASPNYITAMTSNGWVATNTVCDDSLSMIPAGLTDGVSSVNLSTAPGNVAGNAVNAYYNGPMTGTPAAIRTSVLNPANWIAVAGSTPAQTWPTWAFPGSLTVQTATVVNNTTIKLTFNSAINTAFAIPQSNYTGVPGLANVMATSTSVTLTYGTPFVPGTNYTLTVTGIMGADGVPMPCDYTFNFSFNSSVKFATDFVVVNENHGTLAFNLTLANPVAGSVDVVLKGAPFSTATAATDFTYATQTLNFTEASPLTQTINIPIIDDTDAEQQAEYFVLSLENAVGVAITGETLATIYIKDNDVQAPVPTQAIQLDYVVSFDPSTNGTSTCEIVVHDPVTQRLFTTSAVAGYLDIINFANPADPVVINSINMNPWGGVTSVAVKNGIVAVASPNAQAHLPGQVVFFNTDGQFQMQVEVGVLPDNISFTPDGTKVLTANEGQPNSDYSQDPEGSVSIIDISGGIATLQQSDVTTLGFQAYNSPTEEAALIASGVRKLKLTSTMSQDFEPEYITTSADSQKAWVTLQENNAIAEINLVNNTITSVWALGTKDMSLPGNGFDISDNNGEVLIANWPIKTYFIPDAVASYNVNGTNYIVTANEGDEKEYTGFEERTTVGAAGYLLDPVAYPQAAMLKKSYNAGRFRVTNLNGNTDADAEFEQMYAVGSRSFSIFNADTKQIVFDSGDDFEMYTSMTPSISPLFNSDHENNSFKSRSRAKGPEPEGVAVAQIEGRTFAFISLERVGGVMVYDVTDPANVTFVDYKNYRSTSAYTGDHGPEGITFIDGMQSPDGKNYIIVANEMSGTLTIFEIDTTNLRTGEFTVGPKTFNVFPNPNVDGIAYFNRAADIEVYDFSGKLVHSAKEALTINTAQMAAGIYLIKTSEGIVKKLIVK